MRRTACIFAMLFPSLTVCAQWQMQTSNTTADLRGIANVGNGVAWASGTHGTVLRTEDGGYVWQTCAVPPGAETLDFRGVQAFDANTAIVMSSGPGDQSRLYKTTDGCHTWKVLFTNPDPDGFLDAIQFDGKSDGMLLGDPVETHFAQFITTDSGAHWNRQKPGGTEADPDQEAVFAASNSSLVMFSEMAHRYFVTGGTNGAEIIECHGQLSVGGKPEDVDCLRSKLPLCRGTKASGAFSLAIRDERFLAVGGDYTKPNESTATAAWSADDGNHWTASQTPPHGYRSAVAYDEKEKLWITVGPNGTDISTDDGKNWRAVRPNPALHESPDADRDWNALSLPFVVGPHGRIGKLEKQVVSGH